MKQYKNKVAGFLGIIIGSLLFFNAFFSGPNAFANKENAVYTFYIIGIILIISGLFHICSRAHVQRYVSPSDVRETEKAESDTRTGDKTSEGF